MTERAVVTDSATQEEGKIVHLVYLLQAIGFVTGITLIAGAIVYYVKRGDLTSELQKSHFKWQIRTFWYMCLWAFVSGLLSSIISGSIVIAAVGIWGVYRVVRGWLYLYDGKPMYAANS